MHESSPWRRAARIFQPSVQRDVDDELQFHLEQRARELIDAGMDAETAWAEAGRRFGDQGAIRDSCITIDRRQRRRLTRTEVLASMFQDLHFAARTLRANAGFTAVAVLTLALGIGATTALYSVVDAVLLRALPFPAVEQLVVPQTRPRDSGETWSVAYRDYLEWREQGVFASVAVSQTQQRDLTGSGDAIRTTAIAVSEDYFATLGAPALIGRVLGPADFADRAERPIVLSHSLWQRHFGGERDVLGQSVRLRGESGTIVGVMPPESALPANADLWYPAQVDAAGQPPDNFAFQAIARLAPGSTLAQVNARLDALARAAEQEFPAKRTGIGLAAVPLREALVGGTLTRALWVLFGAVGVVLLIACVNIANLLLARATARERELALRSALGASRTRLVRQLLVESLLLAAIGGAVGLLLSLGLIRALVALAPANLPRLAEVGLHPTVVLVALAATTLSALLFGLLPALQASGTHPGAAMVEGGGARTTGGRRARRTASLLVVGEVALALTLLTGAGLLTRSFARLHGVDAGIETQGVLTFQLAIPSTRYPADEQVGAFQDEFVRRVEALPSVEAVGLASSLPLGGGGFYLGRTVLHEGAPEPPAGPETRVLWSSVSPGYFAAMGQALVDGRLITPQDDSASNQVVVVNRRLADEMFPGGDALGRRITSWRDERIAREIVGVVEDARHFGPADTARAMVYVPLAQALFSGVAVAVRTSGEPTRLVPAIRQTLAELDPEMAMARVRTMDEVRSTGVAPQRFNALLLGLFAVLAAVLAAVGLYGLLSYGVTQRARELGVRMALGATGGSVQRSVLARSLTLVGVGIALGLAGSLALTRVLASLLYEVRPTDPLTLASVTALLVAVAMLASWLPARRAARTDPAKVLRA